MELNEYQENDMTTYTDSSSHNSEKQLRKGSYFPYEVYNFADSDDKIIVFVEMLKARGYYIGEDNHIRSKKGVLSSKLMRNGYYMTSAQYDGKTYYFMEHRVIWVWNNGAIPKGLVINHKDYNKANNAIDNLEVMTQKENIFYSKCNANPCRGEKSPKSKLTNKQVEAIKKVSSTCGWSANQIAKLIDMTPTNVRRIIKGERYPDVVECSDIMEAYPIIVDFTRNKAIGEVEELKDYLLGLNGECGELTDIFKKILYHGSEYNANDILLELGDILYYMTAICNVLGIDMHDIMINNNAKLMQRYKDGYSVKTSINRIEENNVTDGDNR